MQDKPTNISQIPPIPVLTIQPPEVKESSYEYYLKKRHLAMLNGQEQFSDSKLQIQKKYKELYDKAQKQAKQTYIEGCGTINITLYKECKRCNRWILINEEDVHMSCHAAIIRDNILLGDRFCSMSRKQLIERLHVTHVVNAARTLANYFVQDGLKYLQLELDDDLEENPIDSFKEASKFIHQALKQQNAKVFIHCNLGKSRSVSVILVYLLEHQNIGIQEGLKIIRQKRPIAQPNVNYMKRLKAYEQQFNKSVNLVQNQ